MAYKHILIAVDLSPESKVLVEKLDGEVLLGRKGAGGRYNKLFREHADVTTISHVHAPNLGAWAQTHRTLPIRYVPVQRFHLFNELPIYIDHRQAERAVMAPRAAHHPIDELLHFLADDDRRESLRTGHTHPLFEGSGSSLVLAHEHPCLIDTYHAIAASNGGTGSHDDHSQRPLADASGHGIILAFGDE